MQIGVPGHLRWGLICGDDWGTLEAMVACRQLGLGYANHGLQVSREKRKPKLLSPKSCVLGKDCGNMSLGPGNWNLWPHWNTYLHSPGDLVLGLRECN